jgi:hypothetical protein
MERDTKIDPVLKSWLDNVIIPVIVREYLAAQSQIGDNGLRLRPSEDSETPPSEPIQ